MFKALPQHIRRAIVGLFAVVLAVLVVNGCAVVEPEGSIPPADTEEARNEESAEADSAGESDTAESDTAESDTADSDVEEGDTAEGQPASLEVTGEYNGVPVGYTAEGHPFRGEPDAPITIYEFSDYQCPFCLRHFVQTEPSLSETYVQAGQVKFVFMDFPLEQLHPNAPAAAAAARCVLDQNAPDFWEMHALLFETQDQWANLSDPSTFFIELAAQTDVELRDFEVCLSSGENDATVQDTFDTAQSLGFSGTPSFQFVLDATGEAAELVGAQPFDTFASWIDTMLAGEMPATEEEQASGDSDIPYWATAEGLSPDPDRPGYTMAGDEYRGNVDAEVVVIEYSDFQCPYCGRHVAETQPILDEQFVETGDVRWVFKHFPLNIHPQAPAAGVASECAAEQDQFWEMHDLLFENVSRWSISDPHPIFVELAEELSLDTEAFEACLDDPEMMARVDDDFADGRAYVQGTPTFIVMEGEQGRIIPGALPAESFVEALNSILGEAE